LYRKTKLYYFLIFLINFDVDTLRIMRHFVEVRARSIYIETITIFLAHPYCTGNSLLFTL